jgi:hypothetical protein
MLLEIDKNSSRNKKYEKTIITSYVKKLVKKHSLKNDRKESFFYGTEKEAINYLAK